MPRLKKEEVVDVISEEDQDLIESVKEDISIENTMKEYPLNPINSAVEEKTTTYMPLLLAFSRARLNFKSIAKNKTNPHFKNKYADLDSVLEATVPALIAEGLVVMHSTDFMGDRFVLKTRLYHVSGEYLETIFPLPNITDSQKLGGAITYAKRYSYCALLCITADEDTDGNESSSIASSSTVKKNVAAASNISVDDLLSKLKERGAEVISKGLDTEDNVYGTFTSLEKSKNVEDIKTEGKRLRALLDNSK